MLAAQVHATQAHTAAVIDASGLTTGFHALSGTTATARQWYEAMKEVRDGDGEAPGGSAHPEQ
jgi:hypothetical protein